MGILTIPCTWANVYIRCSLSASWVCDLCLLTVSSVLLRLSESIFSRCVKYLFFLVVVKIEPFRTNLKLELNSDKNKKVLVRAQLLFDLFEKFFFDDAVEFVERRILFVTIRIDRSAPCRLDLTGEHVVRLLDALFTLTGRVVFFELGLAPFHHFLMVWQEL